MKTKEMKELHSKTVDELKKLLKDVSIALATLKLDHQQNKLKNTRDLFNKRKEIAVLQTILQIKKEVKNG